MKNTKTRQDWNKTMTETLNKELNINIEATLRNDDFCIYGENENEVNSAVSWIEKNTTSKETYRMYYEADEDGDEAWTAILSL